MFMPEELSNPYVPKRWDDIGRCVRPSYSDEVFMRELADVMHEGRKKKKTTARNFAV